MPLTVGTKAPDFTLKSKSSGELKDVTLSANFGKKNTVLLFFPLAFTGVCTQELCDISSGLGSYTSVNADVIAVSVDSPFAQEAWAKKENITLTLASDLNKATAKAYDVIFPGLPDRRHRGACGLRDRQRGCHSVCGADRDTQRPAELRTG